MTSRTRSAAALAAMLTMIVPLAACGGSDDAASDDSISADVDTDVDAADATDDVSDEAEPVAEAEPVEAAEPDGEAEVRDVVTNVRESFDNVTEATSDDGVLFAVGLECSVPDDLFMLIGIRGLFSDDEIIAQLVPEPDLELRGTPSIEGTLRLGTAPPSGAESYTITFPTVGGGFTIDVPGCAS